MMQTYQTVGLKGVSNIFASAYSWFEKIIGFCVLFFLFLGLHVTYLVYT